MALEQEPKQMRELESVGELANEFRHELVSKMAAGELADPALRGPAVSRGLKILGGLRGSLITSSPKEMNAKQRAFGGPALRRDQQRPRSS